MFKESSQHFLAEKYSYIQKKGHQRVYVFRNEYLGFQIANKLENQFCHGTLPAVFLQNAARWLLLASLNMHHHIAVSRFVMIRLQLQNAILFYEFTSL